MHEERPLVSVRYSAYFTRSASRAAFRINMHRSLAVIRTVGKAKVELHIGVAVDTIDDLFEQNFHQ